MKPLWVAIRGEDSLDTRFAMPNDEQSIRDLIALWLKATADGDLPTLLNLMSEDVVFLSSGQQPMRGRDAFAKAFQAGLGQVRIEAASEPREIQISGDLAYCWNHLSVNVTPLKGETAQRRSDYALTIFRKQHEGNWVVFRDANLLAAESAVPA